MINDLRGAFAFLTVLPVGSPGNEKPGRTLAFYPLVGLVIGLSVALVASISFFPPSVTAFSSLVLWVMLTGGLHLDGVADSCDGLLATVEPKRRLEIMKDSRAGSWAVVGLVLLLLGKWISLKAVSPALLILPPVLGRWAMVMAIYSFPSASSSGLGVYIRDGLGHLQLLAASLSAFLMVLVLGVVVERQSVLVVLAVPLAVVLFLGRWAAARLDGGLSGDVYGAICELTELICLVVLAGVEFNG